MTWDRGKASVERLIANGKIERVNPSDELAARLLQEAHDHRSSAALIAEGDSVGAFQLAYDAARKSCAALLSAQGLRATTKGGHIAVEETIREQFGGKSGAPAFARFVLLRRGRRGSEYPDLDTPTVTRQDADEAIRFAEEILDAASAILETGRLDRFS